jgi:cell division septum initiation protein DivIVA
MSKAFDKIKAGLDEAKIVAPYLAEVENLRAELAAERKAQLQMLSQMQKAIDAEKTRVSKLREALVSARKYVNSPTVEAFLTGVLAETKGKNDG